MSARFSRRIKGVARYLALRVMEENFSEIPNKSRPLDAELTLRHVPGKLVQWRRHTRKNWVRFVRVAALGQ